MEIFKEAYLPTIILGFAAVLIFVFVIGGISRKPATAPDQQDPQMSATQPATDPSVPTQPQQPSQDQGVQQLLAQAAQLALNYEFQQAVDLLDSFSGDKSAYPELAYKRGEYAQQASQMVTWADPSQIVNLSFHGLIANPAQAFSDSSYGNSYNKNFVTIGEFSQILEQVYANGYVLVSLDDIFSVQADEGGNISCAIKPLQLPLGKKPLVLTQTMINYYGYMINSKEEQQCSLSWISYC